MQVPHWQVRDWAEDLSRPTWESQHFYSCINFIMFVKTHIASWSQFNATMAIHLGTFETTQFPGLSLLRVFSFKVHFPSFACSHCVLKHQMYLLASIMCLKKKTHIRRSVEKFMNTKYRSAECLLLVPTTGVTQTFSCLFAESHHNASDFST